VISFKLAVRNLFRNRWRSALTMGGVAVAVALMLWTLAFYEGWIAEMVRGATAMETGQVQIQTAAWAEEGRVYQSFPSSDELLALIESAPGVEVASPRVVGHGLIGNEQRSRVARLLGVDPDRESAATPVTEGLVEGTWLSPAPRPFGAPRELVLGSDLARQLRVSPGDELVVFLEAADGSLGNDLLEVVGIVRTGNSVLDRMAAWMHLEDARTVTALEGRAHAILLRTADVETARATADSVAVALQGVVPSVRVGAPGEEALEAGAVEGSTLAVRPWQEILPIIDKMINLTRRSYWIVYLILYAVAVVGILNTQRMSALERRREFGVMMAVGVRPGKMFRMVQVETVVLAAGGALLGTVLGGALAWYHTVVGFDMTSLASEASFTYLGVSFDERVHFGLDWWMLVQPGFVMCVCSLVAGLWPGITAARIEPSSTIAGRVG
jgi:ABC-type lipoprotein release transport system permease subunit